MKAKELKSHIRREKKELREYEKDLKQAIYSLVELQHHAHSSGAVIDSCLAEAIEKEMDTSQELLWGYTGDVRELEAMTDADSISHRVFAQESKIMASCLNLVSLEARLFAALEAHLQKIWGLRSENRPSLGHDE